MKRTIMKEWSNWSGSLRFKPEKYLQPRDEAELCEIVSKAYSKGKKVKLAAAGHSSSPLVKTTDVLVNLGNFKKITHHDDDTRRVSLQSGMTVHETNSALQKRKLALFNTGDVDVQTLAGAISTGTHGTGRNMQNLASILYGVRMINYKGEVVTFDEVSHPHIMRAMRVSLGAFGIFSEITVNTLPLFKLKRIDICTDTETCLEQFFPLSECNRNVDFYWYPRSDETKIRILNEPGQGNSEFDFKHNCQDEEEGWAGEILPRERSLKFDEIEFALDASNAMECFNAIRHRIKEKHRKEVAWRVLVRTIAADDSYLSPHYKRDSISISIHHNAGLPFEAFFKDVEPIFMEYGGRPHWAKKHWRTFEDLSPLYPEWNAYQSIRNELDPEGFFMNEHLHELFNPKQS